MQDRELVAAIVAGDPGGLAEAYDRYAAPLYAYCRSLRPGPDAPGEAARAVTDTFIIATVKLPGLGDPDQLGAWLTAVARNECLRRPGALACARGQRPRHLPPPGQWARAWTAPSRRAVRPGCVSRCWRRAAITRGRARQPGQCGASRRVIRPDGLPQAAGRGRAAVVARGPAASPGGGAGWRRWSRSGRPGSSRWRWWAARTGPRRQLSRWAAAVSGPRARHPGRRAPGHRRAPEPAPAVAALRAPASGSGRPARPRLIARHVPARPAGPRHRRRAGRPPPRRRPPARRRRSRPAHWK